MGIGHTEPTAGSKLGVHAKEIRLVIAASSLGAVCEWYDFIMHGTLAGLFGKLFFPSPGPGT